MKLARFRSLAEEARTVTLGYLLEKLGESESKKASRQFGFRLARERRESEA